MRSSGIDICVCVCIDIRFRFVAVWSETETPASINIEDLNKSLDYCDVLIIEFTIYFSLNREELDDVCR